MNNTKDGASFVFFQCWSQFLNPRKHSMLVEAVSLPKHFWKARKHFEEPCITTEFQSLYQGLWCSPVLLTTYDHCYWLCSGGFVPTAISPASSETDNWSVYLITTESSFGVGSIAILGQHLSIRAEQRLWGLTFKLQTSKVYEKLFITTCSIPPLPFYPSWLYTHCQKTR